MPSPNILLLFTDQQRADTVGALGNPLIKTPVLDRLVREGTTFTRAYTPSPVCVPARFALVTGVAPHQSGVVDNCRSPQEHASIMSVLASGGYQTHGVGKMHFAGGDPRRKWGFESRDFSEEGTTADDFNDWLRSKGFGHVVDPHGMRSEYYYLPQPSPLPAELHHSSWVAERSIDFLKRRDRRRPFFLWSSFIKPHPPFESPNPWNRLYRSSEMPDPRLPRDYEKNQTFWNRVQNRYKYMDGGMNSHLVRTQRAAYYGSISFIDFNLGRILAALGDEIDNTLVVFASDHGEMLGDFGCFGKRCMLEPSARIPLLARLPRRFPSGGRCAAPVTLLDLFPTFAATAGADLRPSSLGGDLAEIAAGHGNRTHVLSQFSQRAGGLYMVAEENWKYIYSAADRREWLFDLVQDPHEEKNLVYHDATGRHLERMRGQIIAQFERDGYEWAVSRGRWRDYPTPRFPRDPRSGVLFQDPDELATAFSEMGSYSRGAPRAADLLGATSPLRMDPETGAMNLPE